jgi:hypothetical protein
MNQFLETIRKYLGWCPQGSYRKIRTFTDPGQENQAQSSSPPGPVVPSTAEATPAASLPEYQENILLYVLLLGGFFLAWDLRVFAVAGIISVIAVYYDAGTLHAGQKFEKESFFGDVVAWRPLTWAVWVLIGSLIFLAVYVFSRQEIFNANN